MTFKKHLIKAGLISIYVLFHIYLLNPARTAIFQSHVNNYLIENVENSKNLSFKKLSFRSMVIIYNHQNTSKELSYKIPFGSYFLLGIIGLIIFSAKRNFFVILISAHTLFLTIFFVTLTLDINQNPNLLFISDYLSSYVSPFLSLGITPISIVHRKIIGIK